MARGRLISKSLGSSRRFHALLSAGGKLGEFCQVLFPLVIANTDDYGKLPGDAFTVKNVVLPSSHRPERDFDRALDIMAECELIERYQVDGRIYIQVNNFDEHQPNLHKPHKPRFPDFPGDSGNYRLKRTESKRTEENGTQNPAPAVLVSASGFERFWIAYPKKKAKDEARKAWDKRRPSEALIEQILRALDSQRRSPDWQKEAGRYIPFPATWLNRGQWTDSADVVTDGLSETARYNLAASDEAERLILESEVRRGGR